MQGVCPPVASSVADGCVRCGVGAVEERQQDDNDDDDPDPVFAGRRQPQLLAAAGEQPGGANADEHKQNDATHVSASRASGGGSPPAIQSFVIFQTTSSRPIRLGPLRTRVNRQGRERESARGRRGRAAAHGQSLAVLSGGVPRTGNRGLPRGTRDRPRENCASCASRSTPAAR